MNRPSLSIIVATCGRPVLMRALRSVASQLRPPDQLLVQWDNSGDWGHTPRNRLMGRASGDWLMFLDDDDAFLPGALDLVRDALATAKRLPHIFRMQCDDGRIIWRSPKLEVGNVSTQCFAVPNGPLGTWGCRYEGDFDFIESTVRLYDGGVVWREEVIAKWRASDADVP